MQRSGRIGRVVLEQVLADRVGLQSRGGDPRSRRRDLSVGRDVDVVGRRHRQPLSFVVAEEERLVLLDRSSERAAVLLVLDRRRARILAELLRRPDIEEIRLVRPVVVPEIVGGAVQRVSAALHDDVDRGASLDAEFRRRRLLDGEVADRVGRHQRRRDADDAGLAQHAVAVVAIVVGNPVDHEIVRRGARSADVQSLEAAAWPMLNAGHHVEQRVEIAAAQRNRLDALRVDAAVQLV